MREIEQLVSRTIQRITFRMLDAHGVNKVAAGCSYFNNNAPWLNR
jgi:hypothetical protein